MSTLLAGVAIGTARGEAEWRQAERDSCIEGEVLLRLR